jgi:hypothetical protein
MRDDYIPQPRPPLTDQAAAEILEFLYELIADFEAAYSAKIRRHRRAQQRLQQADQHIDPFDARDVDPF